MTEKDKQTIPVDNDSPLAQEMSQQYVDVGEDSGAMSLVEHLQELRRRLIICIAALAVCSSGAYLYAELLIYYITAQVVD